MSNNIAKLYIIRHAEADGNLYRRAQGHYDGLITENGKAQLEKLRERFAGVEFDAVYSSDLYRARKTASVLQTNHRENFKELRELCLGIWEDHPWQEFLRKDPEQYNAFMRTWDFVIEGGETAHQVQARVLSKIRDLVSLHKGQTIAIVSHGLAIRAIMSELMGAPLTEPAKIKLCDNTAVSYIEWDDKPNVVFYGDNTHLGDLSTIEKQSWWKKHPDKHDVEFWFCPVRLSTDMSACIDYRRKAWLTVYGTEKGYREELAYTELEALLKDNPKAAQFVMRGDTPVGMIQMKTALWRDEGYGHISLIYLDAAVRYQGLGIQLIGEAVSVYRSLGRQKLRLNVWPDNLPAMKFYQKYGFEKIGETQGELGTLFVLSKSIVPDM